MRDGIAWCFKGETEEEEEKMNALEELAQCRDYLDSAINWLGDHAVLNELKRRLENCEKDLAQRISPVKVLLALTDNQATGSSSPVYGVIGTVPVKVVLVDHRRNCDHPVRIFIVDALSSPTEFVEAVSDEAASYLQHNETLVDEVSEL